MAAALTRHVLIDAIFRLSGKTERVQSFSTNRIAIDIGAKRADDWFRDDSHSPIATYRVRMRTTKSPTTWPCRFGALQSHEMIITTP